VPGFQLQLEIYGGSDFLSGFMSFSTYVNPNLVKIIKMTTVTFGKAVYTFGFLLLWHLKVTFIILIIFSHLGVRFLGFSTFNIQ
jgi:hypothetical protein